MVTEPSMRSPSYPTHWSSSDTSTASLVSWVRMIDCATDDDDDDNDIMMMMMMMMLEMKMMMMMMLEMKMMMMKIIL